MNSRHKDKNPNILMESHFKETLANSGYSENISDKVWKWYNPPKKKQRVT